MVAKLVALYTKPDDVDAFEKAYFETHVPLVEKMPGLQGVNIVRFEKNLMGGDLPYYMMAEMLFENVDAVKAAAGSPEGQAAGANIMSFAAKNVTMLIADEANSPVGTPS